MKTYRTIKYRLWPTDEQAAHLDQCFASVRWVYNAALEQRDWAYAHSIRWPDSDQKKSPSNFDQAKEVGLKSLAKDPDLAWMTETPSECFTWALADLQKAFQNFFAKRASYPSYRKYGENESVTFGVWAARAKPKKDQSKWRANVRVGRDIITFPKIGRIKYTKHVRPKGLGRTATIIKDREQYHVCIVYELDLPEPTIDETKVVGIDLGVTVPVALSNGETFGKGTDKKLLARRDKLKRSISRSKRGSNRYVAKVAKLRKIERKIAASRHGQQHRITTDLTLRFDVFAIEDLKVKNMTASAKGTVEEPGKNVKAKSGLNREILDRAPYAFREKLTYKAKRVIPVNPRNTSRTCPECGSVHKDNRKTQAIFECIECGHADNADVNAAKNILAKASVC